MSQDPQFVSSEGTNPPEEIFFHRTGWLDGKRIRSIRHLAHLGDSLTIICSGLFLPAHQRHFRSWG